MDEFSDGKAIFVKPQNIVWSKIDNPNEWEVQEPYGYFRYSIQLDAWVQNREKNIGTAFYTAPPKREWVGLTDEEINDCVALDLHTTTRNLEKKLKEKNHD